MSDSGTLWVRGGVCVTLDDARTVLPAGAGDVLVRNGRILRVGGMTEAETAGAREVSAEGAIVMPGLVQTHVHLCQTLFRNQADDLVLLDWLRQRIWPLEAAHDAATLAASADLGIAELLLGGTTAVLDMATVHHTEVVFERAEAIGIRLTGGKAMMDMGEGVPPALLDSTRAAVDESRALAARWHGAAGDRLRYAFCPRFLLSCTDELLAATAACLAEGESRGHMLHTHAAENQDELAIVRARTGQGNIEALRARGVLGERSCLAHGIWVDDEERRLLAETHTAIAHCPSSNLKLGSGFCDVPALRAAGVRVGIGADGAACNNRLDAWTEMRLAALLPQPRYHPGILPAADVLRMATRGGAAILGLADQIGSIEVGKRADIIVVDLTRAHTAPVGRATDERDLAGALVYAATAANVKHTLVDGRVLVENHQLVSVDVARLVAEAERQLGTCLQRAGLAR